MDVAQGYIEDGDHGEKIWISRMQSFGDTNYKRVSLTNVVPLHSAISVDQLFYYFYSE